MPHLRRQSLNTKNTCQASRFLFSAGCGEVRAPHRAIPAEFFLATLFKKIITLCETRILVQDLHINFFIFSACVVKD